MLSKLILLVLSSAFFSICYAVEVVYETTFQEYPDDWYATTFEFGPSGALIDFNGLASFDANLCTGDGIPSTCNIFLPDGADSVMVSINQTLSVSGGDQAMMEFCIYLKTVEHGSEEVWRVEITPNNPAVYQSGYFHFSPDWIQAGGYLGLYFGANVSPDDFGSSVYWAISHITVYAYGNALSLQQKTWGAVKATLM